LFSLFPLTHFVGAYGHQVPSFNFIPTGGNGLIYKAVYHIKVIFSTYTTRFSGYNSLFAYQLQANIN
jgi:hypothetical protein